LAQAQLAQAQLAQAQLGHGSESTNAGSSGPLPGANRVGDRRGAVASHIHVDFVARNLVEQR
jgi:hypothetical protein